MAPKTPLRAVTENDQPKARPKTLTAAAESSERDLLITMRDTISTEIGNGVPPHTLAPLMRQLREIDKEIRALDARAEHEAESARASYVDDTYDASAI